MRCVEAGRGSVRALVGGQAGCLRTAVGVVFSRGPAHALSPNPPPRHPLSHKTQHQHLNHNHHHNATIVKNSAKEKVTVGQDVVGNRVRVKVVKNKVAPPFEVAEFDMLFGRGIDALGCVLDAGEACGVVQRKVCAAAWGVCGVCGVCGVFGAVALLPCAAVC